MASAEISRVWSPSELLEVGVWGRCIRESRRKSLRGLHEVFEPEAGGEIAGEFDA